MSFSHTPPDWSQRRYPWSISYERYQIRPTIDMPAADTSLLDIFEQSCAKFAKQPAYICQDQTLTYQQLEAFSLKIAIFLQSRLSPHDKVTQKSAGQDGDLMGQKVGVMLPNILQYPILALGILRAGMVLVNINPLHTPDELAHQLIDANVKTLFVLDTFLPTLNAIPNTPITRLVVCYASDLVHNLKATPHRVFTQIKNQLLPKKYPCSLYYFSQILKQSPNQPYRRPPLTLNDMALLQYTGGTTGIPKGAMLTHGNLIANVLQVDNLILSAFSDDSYAHSSVNDFNSKGNTILTALPLYHVFAFTLCGLYVIYRGFTGLLIPNPRDLVGMVTQLQRYPISFFIGVNTLFNGLLQQRDFRRLDFSGLKASIGGGMAISPHIAQAWHTLTGTPIIEGYGLSETSPVVAFNPLTIAHFTHKIGIPAPSTDILLIDDHERAVAIGERGELVVKGLQVMKGYHNSQDPNDESSLTPRLDNLNNRDVFTKNGYFRTGDIGIMDDQGFIKIVGRKKDMILVSGFNVYPNEIESVINAHPDVIECGAIGIPSDIRGEDPKIFVVRRHPNLTEHDLIEYGKQHLVGYKRPRLVEFINELPKSPVGKILRKELRKMQGLE